MSAVDIVIPPDALTAMSSHLFAASDTCRRVAADTGNSGVTTPAWGHLTHSGLLTRMCDQFVAGVEGRVRRSADDLEDLAGQVRWSAQTMCDVDNHNAERVLTAVCVSTVTGDRRVGDTE
jgi:hypothetical protein